ncbi:MAG: hypothetical protein QOE82_1965 [Thermoanaerobaculia bacterium]|jgi:hypothetical protein|nr:hypothetical protein [Thermoanaerobaculia bacterium]
MTIVTSDNTASIQRFSARLRRSVSFLWAICLTLVVLERFSAATLRVFASGFAADALRWLACQAVAAVPEALFLLGLWWIREALSAFARGELFAPPMTRMLDRVGVVLAIGSAVRIFLVPGACRLLGFDEGHWIAFDAAGMVLGAIGLALKAIAGVLRHASAIQSELDEIF